MKVTQNEIVDRQTVLNIEVDADSLEQHLDRAFKRLVGSVDVPGFRRGKAPRAIFVNAYGRERLVEEALETMVPDVVEKAIEETGLEAAGTPRISVLERDPEPKIEATIPLKPVVTLGDYRSISFDDQPEPVTDEGVDTVLERMREAQATWEPVDRNVKIGDMAVLGSVEGTAGREKIFSANDLEYVVTADATYPVPGFGTEVVGLGSGDSKEFSLILPDDFPQESVAGATATFSLTVTEVKERNVPPLDDELARGAGEGFESLDEMRERVKSDLEKQADEYHLRRLQDKALDAIVEGATVEVAPIIVDHEVEHVITEQQQALARYNVAMADYMSGAGKSTDDMLGEARETALTRIQRSLVLEELGQAEDVKVEDDKVDEEIKKLRESARTPDERASYLSDRARDTVRSMLMRRATLERLVEIMGPAPAGADGPDAGAKSGAKKPRPRRSTAGTKKKRAAAAPKTAKAKKSSRKPAKVDA